MTKQAHIFSTKISIYQTSEQDARSADVAKIA
jgi:hypothetical protein